MHGMWLDFVQRERERTVAICQCQSWRHWYCWLGFEWKVSGEENGMILHGLMTGWDFGLFHRPYICMMVDQLVGWLVYNLIYFRRLYYLRISSSGGGNFGMEIEIALEVGKGISWLQTVQSRCRVKFANSMFKQHRQIFVVSKGKEDLL